MIANPATTKVNLIDVVAYLWVKDIPADLSSTVTLYDKNCAACHGQIGNADGPIAALTAEKPAAFADFSYMFEIRSDVLYAKIRRGGMGTDMPNFGTIFTPKETWQLVAYLWVLAFKP
jgi:high-affinity iron transporter